MPVQLDHLIVPAKNRVASAKLLAHLLGVPWAEQGAVGPFSPVYVNSSLTLDFDEWGESTPKQHYCFRVSQAEFDAILQRIKAAGLPYRSSPHGPDDYKINHALGGRLVYWSEPDGHAWEILTVSYARSALPPAELDVSNPSLEFKAVDDLAAVEPVAALIGEYLHWIAQLAKENYDLSFDVDAMVASDVNDRSKFYPPHGRCYLVWHDGSCVGVGCLKRLAPGVAEIQRMYVRPHVRGIGAGRRLAQHLLDEARGMGYEAVRLESLKVLETAHALYRSLGFVEIPAYAGNSMQAYQPSAAMDRYRASALFMELRLGSDRPGA